METQLACVDIATLGITFLKGVGPSLSKKLQKLAIDNCQDLLLHLPARYQDRTRITPIGQTVPGAEYVIEGTACKSQIQQGKRRSLCVEIEDDSGTLNVRFYYFGPKTQQALQKGCLVRAFGQIRHYKQTLEMIHPELLAIDDNPADQAHFTPVYPLTEGLGQTQLRKLLHSLLGFVGTSYALREWLPQAIIKDLSLPPLHESVKMLHCPPTHMMYKEGENVLNAYRRRLAFEELLAHQLHVRSQRDCIQHHMAPSLTSQTKKQQALLARLPFTLTPAQQRVAQEIASDLKQKHPMQRLLQGDVGSGKTIIAMLALLQAVDNGYQAALMSPTECLAEQHMQLMQQWLTPLGITLAYLSGSLSAKDKAQVQENIASGKAHVAVGTHALFQDAVQFAKLGLVIIDEQHRFGVDQSARLISKGMRDGCCPHQLVMSATPIPRTLAMTAYCDLDCSVIDELPKGRQAIVTVAIPQSRRSEVIARVRHACQQGQQVYWICTLVEEADGFAAKAAQKTAATLQAQLPELSIGLVHGRLSASEKVAVMRRFKQGEHHLLVATTVIEVGVDVENARLMIIENPERLGLAQLHQLRGRVGRCAQQCYCVLLYQSPLNQQAADRLALLRKCTDGFAIAQWDLNQRGPGELLGQRQSGFARLRIADLLRDADLIPLVQKSAHIIAQQHREAIKPLLERWLKTV